MKPTSEQVLNFAPCGAINNVIKGLVKIFWREGSLHNGISAGTKYGILHAIAKMDCNQA